MLTTITDEVEGVAQVRRLHDEGRITGDEAMELLGYVGRRFLNTEARKRPTMERRFAELGLRLVPPGRKA